MIQLLTGILLILLIVNSGNGQYLTTQIHKTLAATEKVNNLYCYTCDTMEDGDLCVDLAINHTAASMVKKCKQEEFVCMIKRFSYTTSNENSTSSPKMWSLERKCAVNCEAGCIVIGERTKLYACTSCCETSYCNTGRGSATSFRSFNFFNILLLAYLCKFIGKIHFNECWKKNLHKMNINSEL